MNALTSGGSFVLVLGVAMLALLPSSPLFQVVPGRDSGVFLYVAQGIVKGRVPYRELWDHKGPILYLINVIGLLTPLPGLWGLWFLRVLCLGGALSAGFSTLRRAFGELAAVVSSAVWLLFFVVLVEDGNMTEEYALAIGFLAFWLIYGRDRDNEESKTLFPVLGCLWAAVFMLRQNLIVSLSVLILVRALWKNPPRPLLLRRFAGFALGNATLFASVLLWLVATKSLAAWWSCSFIYNRVYVGSSLLENMYATACALATKPILASLLVFSLAALTPSLMALVSRNSNPLLLFATIALPVEYLASSLSRRAYLHYFLPWLLPLSILVAALFSVIERGVNSEAKGKTNSLIRRAVVAGPLILAAAWVTYPVWLSRYDLSRIDRHRQLLTEFLIATTEPEDRVLIWGAETGVLVKAHRRSPEPYFYSYPLLTPGYEDQLKLGSFLNSLVKDPPTIIVDTAATNDAIPPLLEGTSGPSGRLRMPLRMAPLVSLVQNRYRAVGRLGGAPWWVVYRLVKTSPVPHPPSHGARYQ